MRPRTTTSRPRTGRSRPRTAATSTGYGENDIVCAISESRGLSPTIGLSFVNLTTSEAVLCQFTDTQTYARTCHKIHVFNPSDILYMSAATESNLVAIIAENLKVEENGMLLTEMNRKYWVEGSGHEYIQRLAFPDDLESLKVSAGGNFFATCCFAAVCPLPISVPIDQLPGYELRGASHECHIRPSDPAHPFRVFRGFYDDRSFHHLLTGIDTEPARCEVERLFVRPDEPDIDKDGCSDASQQHSSALYRCSQDC